MLKNYLKIIIRHLSRNKPYVFINVAGISISLAFCIVAYLNWQFDQDFDIQHQDKDQIFRIEMVKAQTDEVYGVCPAPIAIALAAELPEVIEAVQFDQQTSALRVGDQTFYERFAYATPAFLETFHFPLVEGTINLDKPSQVAISERIAKKYFGNKNPIGKTVIAYADHPFRQELTVTGILEDSPKNSSIRIDLLTNFSNVLNREGEAAKADNWGNWIHAAFIKVKSPERASDIITYMDKFVALNNAANPDWETKSFTLEPLNGMAHNANNVRWNGLWESTPPSAIWGNILMALSLLLTACLNFANMTISLAGKRLKEIGIRKVMGSSRGQLATQLLGESLFICSVAAIIGIGLSTFLIAWYNQMWVFIDLQLNLLESPALMLFIISTVLITTILAGIYPALYISGFSPNSIFHGSVKFGGSNLLSRILLSGQVGISVMAIVLALSFAHNAHFQQTTDLGFQRTGVQTVEIRGEQPFTVLQNDIKQHPKVMATAGVRTHIGDSAPRIDVKIQGETKETEYMTIGDNYLEVMDIQTIEGRAFNPDLETDYKNAVMVNEEFIRAYLPNQNVIGQPITFFDTLQCTIVGVVKDFMQDSFSDPLRPLALKLDKAESFRYLVVRSEMADMSTVQLALSAAWKTHFPNKPFVHRYQDDFLANSLEITTNIKWTTLILAIVTLLLTITGLAALISLNILKRMKEIAIRRILGASVAHVSFLLNRQFVGVVLIGIILGLVSGAQVSDLLLDSIYDIYSGLTTSLTFVAALGMLTIIVFTILLKIRGLILKNPAEILQDD